LVFLRAVCCFERHTCGVIFVHRLYTCEFCPRVYIECCYIILLIYYFINLPTILRCLDETRRFFNNYYPFYGKRLFQIQMTVFGLKFLSNSFEFKHYIDSINSVSCIIYWKFAGWKKTMSKKKIPPKVDSTISCISKSLCGWRKTLHLKTASYFIVHTSFSLLMNGSYTFPCTFCFSSFFFIILVLHRDVAV